MLDLIIIPPQQQMSHLPIPRTLSIKLLHKLILHTQIIL